MRKYLLYRLTKVIRQFRHRLSDIDALPQLTLMGIVIGLCTGGVIVLFRLLIEAPLYLFLPEHGENFEGLSSSLHFIIPFFGAIILALLLRATPKKYRDVGIGNVLDRFHNFQGRMSAGNFFSQFASGVICLVSGQSVGREGPAVHLGASTASLLGQWFKLPHNSFRTLIGCGVAAAISASFDTPVAGVIFAMEVILMNYSIVGFIPIMMASVCGAVVTRLVFGDIALFTDTNFYMHGLWELPIMVVSGLIIGLLATCYMRLQLNLHYFSQYSLTSRLIAAGIITGSLALLTPEILGLGYDTVNLALEGKLALGALCLILFTKIIATACSIGLGMPGGLIGPQIFIGACIGAITGNIAGLIFPESIGNSGLYVLLGMAAMMGAVINAPLAALMAVLELTYNPSVMFPSMLIIVVACMTTRQLFKCEGIFIEQLSLKGKSLSNHFSSKILSHIDVNSVMQTTFVESQCSISFKSAQKYLNSNPLWIVINHEHDKILLRASDLASFLSINHIDDVNHIIDLQEIPGQRFYLAPIKERSTLDEAQQLLNRKQADALFVSNQSRYSNKSTVLGIITQSTIDNYYDTSSKIP